MTKAHDWKPHVAYLFCHESFLALVCIYTVCPSCFAQCVAGSTVGFLCFLFVVLYQVVTTGWTNFKKKEQEPRIMLTIRGAGMKNVLLCVTLLRSENYCIQHPNVSPTCIVAWRGTCRATEAGCGNDHIPLCPFRCTARGQVCVSWQ